MYLKENNLAPKKFLTVIIRTNTPKIQSQSKHSDLLNPQTISGELMRQNVQWMRKTRDIITWWTRTTKMKVLLAPEMDKEKVYAKKWVLDSLPADVQPFVVWRSTFWTVEEANSIYAQCHTVFGIEPHSLIMALTTVVPVVHARSQKHGRKGYIFRDIGLGDWLFDIDTDPTESITAALQTILKDYPGARERVKGAMKVVQDAQQKHMLYLKDSVLK